MCVGLQAQGLFFRPAPTDAEEREVGCTHARCVLTVQLTHCASTSACLMDRSWKASQPIAMPQPPQGLDMVTTLRGTCNAIQRNATQRDTRAGTGTGTGTGMNMRA